MTLFNNLDLRLRIITSRPLELYLPVKTINYPPQVESGVIDSEKVIDLKKEGNKQKTLSPHLEQKQGWVLGWSSRPEVTPPKEAQYSHSPGKQNKGRVHRKTNPLSFTDALLLRLE